MAACEGSSLAASGGSSSGGGVSEGTTEVKGRTSGVLVPFATVSGAGSDAVRGTSLRVCAM
jgi:hypothetical protein